MMKSVSGKILAIYGLVALLGSVACENIALIKRPTPQLDGDEIVGEITRIDSRLKQIYLRPTADVPPAALRHRQFAMTTTPSFLAAENIR